MQITLTDAERTFADSAEGRRHVADAERRHRTSEAHKGRDARPWTDAMQAEAVRDGAVKHARASLSRAVVDAAAPEARAVAEARRITAQAMRQDEIRNGWKS